MIKAPYVYLLASRCNGTLYTGVTSNLIKRVWEHKNDLVEVFTKRYGVHLLVWIPAFAGMTGTDSGFRLEPALECCNRGPE